MLEINDLHVSVGDRQILKGFNLKVVAGEVAAIMGPNGTGKSTLSYVIAGREGYSITRGEILLNGVNLLNLPPHLRAANGVFLAFQYPVEIPGVACMQFLKAAMNAQRRSRGEDEINTPEFMKQVREESEKLKINNEMLRRPLNSGFSGGEKKRMEILQMALLQPKLSILDETDSGLDIDALKTVSEGVNSLRRPDRAFLIITHYQRLLDYIKPDKVHVMAQGRIQKSGGAELALELEKHGYQDYISNEAA
jgi:Fe-S cluster assembly ATP-binding protein